MKGFLELPHGIPSADTFERVFSMIDPDAFKSCFLDWVQAICQLSNGEVIAIDGKTLRRSHDKSQGIPPIHMISAWACANGLVIGQIKTDEKSNEITAIPELLKRLEIKGCTVTIDAMGCQKKIARTIVKKGADYVFSLKGNQSNLHDDVKLFFQGQDKELLDHHETVDGEHGKVEIRNYWVSSDIQWLYGREKWKKLTTICMVERERQFDNKTEKEVSYYISSLGSDSKKVASAIRNHWRIENSLHWVLDMTFREDESRIRKKMLHRILRCCVTLL